MPKDPANLTGATDKEGGAEVWTSRDTGWMLNLFGTAIGAGVLYLPISASSGGIWPLVILGLLSGPMVWLAHRNLVRFCLSSKTPEANITVTVREHFGDRAGYLLNWAYCLSVYPILLIYGIGLTNVVLDYFGQQLAWPLPSRLWLSLGLIVFLVVIMHTGEKWMLRAVKLMVYPLVLTLLSISAFLIPQWQMTAFSQGFSLYDILLTLFLTTPLLIFSFNHSPACSAFALAYRQSMGSMEACSRKTEHILKKNTALLMAVILFFVFSCVLSLTPAELNQAKMDNMPVLSVLAIKTGNGFFVLIAPLIALMAIASSFFGVYLGALEGLQGIVIQQWLRRRARRPLNPMALRRLVALFIVLTCWGASYANWSVIGLIEAIIVPILAMILYVMPVYACYRVKSMTRFRNKLLDGFIATVGVIAIFGFIFSKLL